MSDDPFHAAASVASIAGFTNDLAAHLEPGGHIVSTPEYFVMFRAVPVDAAMDQVLNPWWRWPAEECDCWYIWLAAGDLAKAGEMLVREFGAKKWLAFQREGPPRYWRFESTISWLARTAGRRGGRAANS